MVRVGSTIMGLGMPVARLRVAVTGLRASDRFQARWRRGFTLMELMVSISVLLLLLTMVAWIFRTATHASGIATASNEQMGTLRTAEQQLGVDFEGLLRDSYFAMWYQLTQVPDPANPTQSKWVRTDRMVFFTAGDHSSIIQLVDQSDLLGSGTVEVVPPDPWDKNQEQNYQPIRSSIARVFLGHAIDASTTGSDNRIWTLGRRLRVLVPQLAGVRAGDTDDFEYDVLSLDEWNRLLRGQDSPNPNAALAAVFGNNGNGGWMSETVDVGFMRRPNIKPKQLSAANTEGRHMLFLPGCGEFKIQRWIEYWPADGKALGPNSPYGMPRWWPEDDIDGNGIPNEANTTAAGTAPDKCDFVDPTTGTDGLNIREYFNGPPAAVGYPTTSNYPWYSHSAGEAPKAIKITIRLYDPNGRIPDGQVFTMTFTLH